MKKLTLFDIDNTLFDFVSFRERLYKAIASVLGRDYKKLLRDMEEVYEETKREVGLFKPKVFSARLAKRLGRKTEGKRIEEAILAADNFKDGLYKESLGVVEKLSKIGTVGIFSRGFDSFQKRKIRALKHLLDEEHIYIIVDKKKSLPEILKKYKNFKLYLVDDALDVLYAAWRLEKDTVTIWVKRGQFAKQQKEIEGFKPTGIITNLEQAVAIVERS